MPFNGKALRAERLKSGKRIEEVAVGTAMCVGAIYNYESGRQLPDANRVERLANFFGCSMETMFKEVEGVA